MNRLKLMQVMNKGYDEDGTLAQFYEPETGKPIRVHDVAWPDVSNCYGITDLVGIPVDDTLAAFIVAEAADMWTDNIGEDHLNLDVDEVISAMQTAQRDLQNVIDALEENYE